MPEKTPWRCGPIWTVADKVNILTMNKSLYRLEVESFYVIQLQGGIDRMKSKKNGFSDEYITLLENGFPDNWRYKLKELIFVCCWNCML